MPGASENVQQVVVDTNFKNVAEAHGFYAALMAHNAIANQKLVDSSNTAHLDAMHKLTQLFYLSGGRKYTEADIQEANAEKVLGDAGQLSVKIAELNAAVASIQQAIKAAQTTPPQTG
jgi:hypothetical protein